MPCHRSIQFSIELWRHWWETILRRCSPFLSFHSISRWERKMEKTGEPIERENYYSHWRCWCKWNSIAHHFLHAIERKRRDEKKTERTTKTAPNTFYACTDYYLFVENEFRLGMLALVCLMRARDINRTRNVCMAEWPMIGICNSNEIYIISLVQLLFCYSIRRRFSFSFPFRPSVCLFGLDFGLKLIKFIDAAIRLLSFRRRHQHLNVYF